MTPQHIPIWRDLLWLTLALCLLFSAFLGVRPLMVPDEGRYAEIPREMVASGDYLTPRLNYIKYFEKPPLFYWTEAAAIKTFGLNEWSLRAPVGLMGLLGCLMLYIAGLKLYDRRTGILACFILATCTLYFSMARFIITDMLLTLWITISLLLFILGTRASIQKQRYYFWGMYACAALAVLSKGLAGAVLPGLVIFVWLCFTNQWRQLKTYRLVSGIVLFLLLAAPWHILVQLKNPEFFRFYFIDQHFLRYLTDYAGREQAVWFFPAVTLGGFFPWVCFLLTFLIRPKKIWLVLYDMWQQRQTRQSTLFLILWPLTLFIFFSLSKSQLLSYALPIMPPLALLLAHYFSTHWQDISNNVIRYGFSLLSILGVLMSIGGFIALQLNRSSSQTSFILYIAIVLCLISTLGSTLIYRRWGIRTGIIALIISISPCFMVADLSYPYIDDRSVKSLALTLKPRLKPNTEVLVYHEYYQDLPAYLGRRVIVAGYRGELEFGTTYEDTHEWMVDSYNFWYDWRNKPGMFMIMSLKDYAKVQQQGIKPLYPVEQTTKNILLTNTH